MAISRKSPSAPSRVTLQTVADRAGVSAPTVSRILNGTAVVSEEKRFAVREAIAALGFVPDPVARGLAGGRTFSVGVITQAIDSPFYGSGLRGIEDQLGEAGYTPLFMSGHWQAAEEAKCISTLQSRRVDGLIVLTGRLPDRELKSTARTLPVVVTGRTLKATNLLALDFDNREGARLATAHLIDLGHRRIAFIGGDPAHPDAVDRQLGYRLALQSRGLRLDEALEVEGAFTEESGARAMERLLDQGHPFSAVFAANDQMAFGAALALYRRGLRIPDDISLVGFDDVAGAVYSLPPLTTVHYPIREMGALAARAMLSLLNRTRLDIRVPSPQLVRRESTRPLKA